MTPATEPAKPDAIVNTPDAASFRQQIPNLLTIARVLLAVAFFGVLSRWYVQFSPVMNGGGVDWVLIIAAALFIIAAATDALDGHLARKWNVVSAFGRIMDPFADKLLVIGAFAFLAGPGFTYGLVVQGSMTPGVSGANAPLAVTYWSVSGVQPWMVALILGRELLVTSIRGVLEGQGISFPATWSGKLKMIMQCICIPGVLLLLNFAPSGEEAGIDWPWLPIQILVGVTVFVTAWSGVPYVLSAMRALRDSKPVTGAK